MRKEGKGLEQRQGRKKNRDHHPELPDRTHFTWAPRKPESGTDEERESGLISALQAHRAFITRALGVGDQVLVEGYGFTSGMLNQIDYFYTRFHCTPIMDVFGVGDDLMTFLLIREDEPEDRAAWEKKWRTIMKRLAYGIRRDQIQEDGGVREDGHAK